MSHIIILFSSHGGQTQKIAYHISDRLYAAGHAVTIHDVRQPPSAEELADADGFVIGSWIRGGRPMGAVRRFVHRNLPLLSTTRSAFFSVSLLQISHRQESRQRAAQYVPLFLQETGWRPQLVAAFAGAMNYTRFGWIGKRLMRAIWRKEGLDADINLDYEYTRWDQVDSFAEQFSALFTSDGKETETALMAGITAR